MSETKLAKGNRSLGQNDIFCKNVSKRFADLDLISILNILLGASPEVDGFEAVHDVSFSIKSGKFLGILGRNGAGKSTLLRTVGGIYEPTSGVVVLGHEANGIYELGVSQKPMMTGREYAERWLMLNGFHGQTLKDMIDDIHVFSELDDYFEKPIGTYSSGMKARLYFGVATAPSSKIFLIDEVLSVGDIYFTAKCWGRLRKKLLGGASGILATHDWPAVLKLCENSFIMTGGKMEDYGPSKEIVRKYILPPEVDRQSAYFDIPHGYKITTKSAADFKYSLNVISQTEMPLYVGMSVEQFVPTIGWEHILHGDPVFVGEGGGTHQVSIEVPLLPLASGDYALNLFLQAFDGASGTYVPCDQRGWLCGNEVLLNVESDRGNAGYDIPVVWRIL